MAPAPFQFCKALSVIHGKRQVRDELEGALDGVLSLRGLLSHTFHCKCGLYKGPCDVLESFQFMYGNL